MDSSEYSLLAQHVKFSVAYVLSELKRVSIQGRSSIETEFHVLLGLLIRPEFTNYDDIEILPGMLKTISNLDESILLSFSDDFDEVFVNIVSRFYSRMKYEINVNMNTYNESDYEYSLTYDSYSEKLSNIEGLTKK